MIAKQDMLHGNLVTGDAVEFKRPRTGISPCSASGYFGKSINRPLLAGSVISDSDLE